MTTETIDLTDAMTADEITLAEVIDRTQAALKYSQELFTAGANPEYWRGRIDMASYILTSLSERLNERTT